MSQHPNGASNPWFAISVGLMGVIVGYGIGSAQMGGYSAPVGGEPQQVGQVPTPAAPTPPPPAAPKTPPTVDDDPMIGSKTAKVTIIEFTDYQCPFCERHFTQTYGQIKKNYIDTGKIKYVIRDYPLGFHPHAEKAAEAAGCAQDQGKYWEMHDKLFMTMKTWSPAQDAVSLFKKYAVDLKLNAKTFNTCLDTAKYASEIQKDMTDGANSGVNGTPGFWVLGPDNKSQFISGAVPYETFKQAIDSML